MDVLNWMRCVKRARDEPSTVAKLMARFRCVIGVRLMHWVEVLTEELFVTVELHGTQPTFRSK